MKATIPPTILAIDSPSSSLSLRPLGLYEEYPPSLEKMFSVCISSPGELSASVVSPIHRCSFVTDRNNVMKRTDSTNRIQDDVDDVVDDDDDDHGDRTIIILFLRLFLSLSVAVLFKHKMSVG